MWKERQMIVANHLLATWRNSLHAKKMCHARQMWIAHFTCGVNGVLVVALAMEPSVEPGASKRMAEATARIVKVTPRKRRRATQAQMNLLQQVVVMVTIQRNHVC
jgi:hypothetical protein